MFCDQVQYLTFLCRSVGRYIVYCRYDSYCQIRPILGTVSNYILVFESYKQISGKFPNWNRWSDWWCLQDTEVIVYLTDPEKGFHPKKLVGNLNKIELVKKLLYHLFNDLLYGLPQYIGIFEHTLKDNSVESWICVMPVYSCTVTFPMLVLRFIGENVIHNKSTFQSVMFLCQAWMDYWMRLQGRKESVDLSESKESLENQVTTKRCKTLTTKRHKMTQTNYETQNDNKVMQSNDKVRQTKYKDTQWIQMDIKWPQRDTNQLQWHKITTKRCKTSKTQRDVAIIWNHFLSLSVWRSCFYLGGLGGP